MRPCFVFRIMGTEMGFSYETLNRGSINQTTQKNRISHQITSTSYIAIHFAAKDVKPKSNSMQVEMKIVWNGGEITSRNKLNCYKDHLYIKKISIKNNTSPTIVYHNGGVSSRGRKLDGKIQTPSIKPPKSQKTPLLKQTVTNIVQTPEHQEVSILSLSLTEAHLWSLLVLWKFVI